MGTGAHFLTAFITAWVFNGTGNNNTCRWSGPRHLVTAARILRLSADSQAGPGARSLPAAGGAGKH